MYCPNCGKDCGNANFCPNCGKKLSVQSAAPSAWAPGMPCPHCGGTKLDGKNCAFCGAVLVADPPVSNASDYFDQKLDSYDIPHRKFFPNSFVKHCFSIEKAALVIESGGLFTKRREVIPYQNLTKAEYKLFNNLDYEITFHYIDPKSSTASTSVLLGKRYEFGSDLSYHAFWVIKHLAPSTAIFRVEYPSVDESTAAILQHRDIDIGAYFDRFNPLRTHAANELCHVAQIPQQQAQKLIDDLFFTRQMKLYNADSLIAVRDYNRIKSEIDRELDADRQDIQEHRNRRKYNP